MLCDWTSTGAHAPVTRAEAVDTERRGQVVTNRYGERGAPGRPDYGDDSMCSTTYCTLKRQLQVPVKALAERAELPSLREQQSRRQRRALGPVRILGLLHEGQSLRCDPCQGDAAIRGRLARHPR